MLHSTRRSGRSGYLPQSARTGDNFDHSEINITNFDHSANAATKKSVSFAFSSPPATANATTTNPKPACSTHPVRPAASQLQAASVISEAIRRTPRPLGSGRKDGGKPLRQAGAEALKGFELKSDYLLQRALNEKSASSAAGVTVTDSARAAVVQTISARSDNFERAALPQSSAAGSHSHHQHMTRPSYMTPVVPNDEEQPHPHPYPRHEQVQDLREQPNPIPNTERSGTSSSATSRSRQQSARGQQGGAGAAGAQQNMELDAADQARVYEYFRNMQVDDEERQAEEAFQRQNKYESGGFSAREDMYERSNAIRNEARNRNFSHTTPFANHYERDGGEFVGIGNT